MSDDAKHIKYAVPLGHDIEALIPKFSGAMKGVERLVRSGDKDVVNLAEAKRLDEKVQQLFLRSDELKTWASKLGVKTSSAKRRKT